jgi:hypothetical protein
MTASATTVEIDSTGFDDLKTQILEQHSTPEKKEETKPEPESKTAPISKKYIFKRGEESVGVDEDFELEFMADKKPVRLSLRELKDRAAGDVAIKNRMHSLAEEKKKVQSTLKEFAAIAKDDPLGALEYISDRAKEADNDFEYNAYLSKLADQAERLGKMDEKERKNLELDKKLKKAEQNLSQKERQHAVVLRKQEMLSDYPEIGDSEFNEMVDAVLSNDDLLQSVEDEKDVMDKVESLIQETLIQKDIINVINDINPSYANDQGLVFTLSDQIRLNPDLNEEDVRDILSQIIKPSTKQKDIRTLSNKQRQAMGTQFKEQDASPYELLKAQILDKKSEFSRTPKYMR